MFKSQVIRNRSVVVFYGIGFASELNAHSRYGNLYLLNNLTIVESSEKAAILCLDTVLDFQKYTIPVELFNKIFKLDIK